FVSSSVFEGSKLDSSDYMASEFEISVGFEDTSITAVMYSNKSFLSILFTDAWGVKRSRVLTMLDMARGRGRIGGITGGELLLYARLRTADESLTDPTSNGDMPRGRGGITRRVGLSYAPNGTTNEILDDLTSNGDKLRGRGGNTRKEGLSNAPQGTGDEIVSDSTSNGNGNETSRENVVVTNSGFRSTIESSQKEAENNYLFLENSSQCSRVITKIFKERIDDGAFTWRKETTLKRPPNPFELFVYTHTKNNDKETFIDKKAKTINDNMLRLRESREANHAEGESSQPVNESGLYYEAVGGVKKRNVYGLGSQAFAYYLNPANRSSATYMPHVPLENNHLDIPVPSTECDTEDNNEADIVGGTQNPNTSKFEEHEFERTRLRLFQFSLHDQASNWLERLPAGSITTWEDLTTRFLAQFFPPGRTAKLRNDILMFQQHHGESLSEAWTRFKDLLQKVPHHGIDLWLQDLALYDNESWNDPRDFAKPVKAIALPQDVPSTSDRRLIELENQWSPRHSVLHEDPEQAFVEYASSRTDEAGDARLTKFEADFKQQQSEMTNKIDTVLKVIIDRMTGALPSDTVKNPKVGTRPVLSARSYPIMEPQCSTQIHSSINTITIHPKQQSDSHDDKTEENEEEKRNSPKNHFDPSTPPDPSISFITKKVLKLNPLFESLGLVPPSPNAELVCTKEEDRDVMVIKIIPRDDNSHKEEPEPRVQEVEYFDIFP
ncbi:MAK10-like protein, partial [Tanacetum coccineum]